MDSLLFGAIFGSSVLIVQKTKKKLHPGVKEILESFSCWALDPRNDKQHAIKLGYINFLEYLPDEIWGGFCGAGCPLSIYQPKLGESVIDLGSGLGGDVAIMAQMVGSGGQITGIDIVPDMIQKSKQLALQMNLSNISFYEEKFDEPLNSWDMKTCTADLVTSNGVFNLCIDKKQAFENAFDLLKPGGRFVFSDVFKILLDGG